MSDFDGILVMPSSGGSGSSGGGQSGPVTGSDNFFVNQLLDARGRIANSTGNLVLSGTTTLSGNLNCLGTINAPISASDPTGSQDYQIGNSLDVRGYLTNSLSGIVAISGNMNVQNDLTVAGNLNFNTASFDNRYVSVGAYGPYTASIASFTASTSQQLQSSNTFSSSVAAFTASTTGQLQALNLFTSSQLTTNSTLAGQVTSLQTFTGSQTSTNSAVSSQLSSLQAFTGSQTTTNTSISNQVAGLQTFTGSASPLLNSLAGFTSSQALINTSVAAFTSSQVTFNSAHNAFSASVNAFTSSQATFNSAHNAFTGSADSRYVLTSSFTNPQVVSMVTGTLDTRYAAFGSTGGSGSGGGLAGGNVSTPYQFGVLFSGNITFTANNQTLNVYTVPSTLGGYTINGVVIQHIMQVFVTGAGNTAGTYGFNWGYNNTNTLTSTRYLPTSASAYCSTPLEYSNYNLDVGKPGNNFQAKSIGWTATSTSTWVLVGFFY